MSNLSIERASTPQGEAVLRVTGVLDAKSAPEMVARAREIMEEGHHLILNLRGITFIASSGVGSLLAMVEDFSEAGLEVHLAELGSAVESVIRLLNLHKFLKIHASEADAIGATRRAA